MVNETEELDNTIGYLASVIEDMSCDINVMLSELEDKIITLSSEINSLRIQLDDLKLGKA